MTGCPHQNKVECDNQVIRSPVNVSSTIKVRLGRNPDGAQFRCEAQLALEEQPPPPTNSNVLSLSVHCEYCSVDGFYACVRILKVYHYYVLHNHAVCCLVLISYDKIITCPNISLFLSLSLFCNVEVVCVCVCVCVCAAVSGSKVLISILLVHAYYMLQIHAYVHYVVSF